MAPITTIVHFEVPRDNIDEFFPAWRDNQELMSKQLGLIGGVFYRCTDPDGSFQFINVARWQSAEALEAALKSVGEEQKQRNNDRDDMLKRLGVKVRQSNYTEELRY